MATPDLMRREGPQLLSVVVPAFNEEGNVRPLYEAVRQALEGQGAWELVLVDDGSRDATFAAIVGLSLEDERVRGLSLSRNFGHQYALLAGLHAARGEAVVSMDGDLQHPPALLPTLVEKWREGYNIVHTQRLAGKETSFFKRKTSDWYYRVFSWLSGVRIEEGQSDFRLTDRKVVQALTRMEEAQLFLRGLVVWVGFKSTVVPYQVGQRHWGVSKYNLRKMLRFAAHGITSFSTVPLQIGVGLGFATSALAVLELIYVTVSWALGSTLPGWASLAGLVSLLFGMNFVLLGFLGIYIGHVFQRVQHHPAFLVERTTDDLLGRKA